MNSDRKLKKDIVPINNALDKVLSLHGYTFTWKKNNKADIGVIAQEVEQAFPQAVQTNEFEIKSVKYANLIAPLIEAIRELNTNISNLYTHYLDQESKIDALEQRISTLESLVK